MLDDPFLAGSIIGPIPLARRSGSRLKAWELIVSEARDKVRAKKGGRSAEPDSELRLSRSFALPPTHLISAGWRQALPWRVSVR